MANSKIPNVALTDTFNTQRRRFNQLLDSVGDVSTLETIATDITSAVNENHNRLDSINTVELLSPRMTLSDASATNNIAGDLILSNALTVQDSAYITGNLYVGGNLTVDGIANLKAGPDNNINLGDGTNDTDTVTFKANIASHLIPNVDNTYDLGSADSEWRHAYFDGTVNADNLAADSATIGTLKVSDLTDNRVVISGASGEIEDDAYLTFDGSRLVVGAAGADVTGMDADSATMGTAKVTDLTDNRVVIAGTNGELEDDANLTYDGTDLSANSLIVTDLTNNRVVIAGTGGAVEDDANLTYDGTDLSTNSLIVGDLTNNRVVIAGTGGAIEDDANLTFDGTTFEVGASFDVVASTGNTIIGGTFDVTGATNLNNTTQASSTTSGALIVDGGVGIAKNTHVGGTLNVTGNTTLSDLAVNGGDLTTTVTTFNLVNTNATTVSFAGAGTSIDIGAASGTTSINNNLDVDLDLNVDGGDITTNQSSFNLLNTNATTINFGGAATTINIGDEIGGNTTIRQSLIVDSSLTVRGDFNVAGDFIVTGNQKNVASFTVMNSGIAVNDANRAGLAVDRPSDDSAVVQWNELGNYWEVGTVNTDAGGGTNDVKQIARQHDSATFTNLYQTGTGATRIPSGTTAERPTARQGQIRYNTTLSAFEGYSGANWGSLGGLIDVDQDTKIIAERSAGNDSDTLTFITGGVETASLNDSGFDVNVALLTNRVKHQYGGQLVLESRGGANPSVRIQAFNDSFSAGSFSVVTAGDEMQFNSGGQLIRFDNGSLGFVMDPAASNDASLYAKQTTSTSSTNIKFKNGTDTIQVNAGSFDINAPVDINNALTVTDSAYITGNLVVGGNLTVSGTTTTVNTETINLADNIILINSNATGTPASINDGGIEVERGSYDNVQLIWDESQNYWVAATDSDNTLSRIATANWINAGVGLTFNSTSGEISHNDTSSVGDVVSDNSGNTFIQDVTATFDSFGHVTGFSVDTNTVAAVGVQAQGGLSVDGSSNLSIDSAQIRQHIEPINFVGGLTASSLRSSTDITLDAQGQDIYFSNGTGGDTWTWNLPTNGIGSFVTPASYSWEVAGDYNMMATNNAFVMYGANGTIGNDSIGQRLFFNIQPSYQRVTASDNFELQTDDGYIELKTYGTTKNITLDATGDITLDADGNNIYFKNGGGADTWTWTLNDNASGSFDVPGDFAITLSNNDNIIEFRTTDTNPPFGTYGTYGPRLQFATNDFTAGWGIRTYGSDRVMQTRMFFDSTGIQIGGDFLLDAQSTPIYENAEEVNLTLRGSLILDGTAPLITSYGDITLAADGNNIYFTNGGGGDTWTWTLNDDATGSFVSPDYFTLEGVGGLELKSSYLFGGDNNLKLTSYAAIKADGTSFVVTGDSDLQYLRFYGFDGVDNAQQIQATDGLRIEANEDIFIGNAQNINAKASGSGGNIVIEAYTSHPSIGTDGLIVLNGETGVNIQADNGTIALARGAASSSDQKITFSMNDKYQNITATDELRLQSGTGYGVRVYSDSDINLDTATGIVNLYDDGVLKGYLDYNTANQIEVWVGSSLERQMNITTLGVKIEDGLFVGSALGSVGATGEIRATNDITAFYSSDINLKENIVEIDGAMDKISSIRGVYFDWTDEHIESRGGEDGYFVRKHDVGVIAQEVEEVFPEVVRDRENGTKSVDYQKMVALLIEGMKEQQQQIDDLKEEIRLMKE